MSNEMLRPIEIAKYPIRCHKCGKTEVVRVMVFSKDLYRTQCNDFSPDGRDMITHRIAPNDWSWTLDADNNFMPVWVCPNCGPGNTKNLIINSVI